jgi:hypothetical protein
MIFTSCDPEPTGPELDCHLLPLYNLEFHAVDAAKVFDVRTDPPTEIKNGTLEYDLSYQWVFLHDDDPVPFPYSEYFIDTVQFIDDQTAKVQIFEGDQFRNYTFNRNDCQIDMMSAEDDLHFELTRSGDEIAEQRFAIYEHQMPRPARDTFLFIEFRLGPFESYESIIKQFALDHPGVYDTIAIERVRNKTRE